MKQQHCLPISGPLDTFCCGCNKKYFEYKHSTVKIFATTRPVAVAARHWTGVSSYSSFTADRRGKYFSRNIISKTFMKNQESSHLWVSAYPGSGLAIELDTYECRADVLRFVSVFAVVFPLSGFKYWACTKTIGYNNQSVFRGGRAVTSYQYKAEPGPGRCVIRLNPEAGWEVCGWVRCVLWDRGPLSTLTSLTYTHPCKITLPNIVTYLEGCDVRPDHVAGVVAGGVQPPGHAPHHAPPPGVPLRQHEDVAALDQLQHQRVLPNII